MVQEYEDSAMAALTDAGGYFISISKSNVLVDEPVFLNTSFVPNTMSTVGERHSLLGGP